MTCGASRWSLAYGPEMTSLALPSLRIAAGARGCPWSVRVWEDHPDAGPVWFISPDEWCVFLDHYDIGLVAPDFSRDMIPGTFLQDVRLFGGTLRDKSDAGLAYPPRRRRLRACEATRLSAVMAATLRA